MKNRFLKLGFMAMMCAMLSVSCSSCGGDDDPSDDSKPKDEASADQDKNPSDKPSDNPTDKPADTKKDIDDNVTAMSVAQQMYPGWNLANTMEGSGNSVSAETSWQKTPTSKELAQYIKAQGFKSVRIPCNWYMHMSDAQTFTIDKAWMARVTEVVDYFVNEGIYVMLNEHWDGGWLEELGYSTSNSSYSAVSDSYVKAKADILHKLWTQIANNFKDYDEHLLFAGQNEPFQNYNIFDKGLGNKKNTTLAPTLMKYNQTFVDAVRATGGNNAKRILVIQAPGISFDGALVDNFALSTDSRENAMILEVHHYQPWDFAGGETGNILYWGAANKDTKYYPSYLQDESSLQNDLKKLRNRYSDRGTPMIIGEYGANWRDVSGKADADQAKHDASIKAFHKAVNQLAPENGMVPMVWDINSLDRQGLKGIMTIIDRSGLKVFSEPAMEGIKEGAAAASWMK